MPLSDKALGQKNIPSERLQNVLPRPERVRRANDEGRSAGKCADRVGYQAIFGPISTADNIPGPNRGNRRRGGGGKEAAAERRDHELRASLAAAVRVAPAERIDFAIGPRPFSVFIALVASHDDNRAYLRAAAHRFQQVHRAAHIGRIGAYRVPVGCPNKRLGRQVEDNLGLAFPQGRFQEVEIADITAAVGAHARGDPSGGEGTVLGFGGQGVPEHLSTHSLQQQA